MNESITYDANKKNGFISAILHLLFPALGFFYTGHKISGIIWLIINLILVIFSFGVMYFVLAPIFFVVGFFTAKSANQKLALELSQQSAVNNAPRVSFDTPAPVQQPVITQQQPIQQQQVTPPAIEIDKNQDNKSGTPQKMFQGLQFLGARIPTGIKDWKKEYDFISVETGQVILSLREGEISGKEKLARQGSGGSLTSFDLMNSLPNGAQLMRFKKAGGLSKQGEVFDSSGMKIASLNRAGMATLNTECLDAEGSVFFTKTKGLGKLANKFEILTEKKGEKIGLIELCGDSYSKKLLGSKVNLLSPNYEFEYLITLDKELDDKTKALLINATYLTSHTHE